jgi:xanthine dehydrogenase accessory factor
MSGAGGTWLLPLRDWLPALIGLLGDHDAVVRVVLAGVQGSAPRRAGDAMLVTRDGLLGTIGGGQLEYDAVAAARRLLAAGGSPAALQRVVLAADAGQCCGGVVQLWFERLVRSDRDWLQAARRAAAVADTLLITAVGADGITRCIVPAASRSPQPQIHVTACSDGASELVERLGTAHPPLWLYGAGHVGQAFARIAFELPLALTWIDARPGLFPAGIPPGVSVREAEAPVASVAAAPAGTRFLIMTHDHALDFELCRAVLQRQDFAWVGLIGSRSKAARFRSRLARAGVPAAAIARLSCPVGLPGIYSKWPGAIAVAVAAELMLDIGVASAERAAGPQPAVACPATDCSGCRSR